MDEERLYEATLRNLPFKQAQAMYRLFVNLSDEEPMYGDEGLSWSGIIPGERDVDLPERTITIDPMPTHERVTRERDAREMAKQLKELVDDQYFEHSKLSELVDDLVDRLEGRLV